MALDERERSELAGYLEGRLDPSGIELLMKALKAPEWGELAAKEDLQSLATREELHELDHKVDLVEQRLKAEMHRVARTQLLGFVSIVAIFNTGLFAVAAWIRF
jgi:hypothetical protein